MKKLYCCCFAVLWFGLPECPAQDSNPVQTNAPVLTLDNAVAVAAKGNKQVQISSLDVTKASESVAEAKTNRWPQLKTYVSGGAALRPIDFTIPAGVLGVYPATGPIPARDSKISTPQQFTAFVYASAAQPLSQLYKVNLAVRESQVGEQLARESLRQSRQDTAQQVKQAYYQVVQTQSQIAGADATLKYLVELSALVDRNLVQQTALKADSLNVMAKLNQQRYQLLTLRNRLDTQKEALNRLLGRDLRTEFSVEVEPLPSPSETELPAAQKKALEQRSELREAQLQSAKAELEVRRERAEYLPDISLQVSYFSLPNVAFAPQNVVNAGFLLEWQPFDWGQKKHRIEELRNSSKQATLTRQDAEQQVLLDVNAKFRQLLEARALLATQAAVQEAEREKVRVMMNRYAQKAALLSDLLQEESSLTDADSRYQQALANFWTAKASFDHAIGEE